MKKICPLLLLLFAGLQAVAQAPVEKNIAYIREQFKKINSAASTVKPDTIDVGHIATEGADMLVYKSKGNIIKLKVSAYGETSRSVTEYYFDSREMIFAYVITYTYNRSIYWDQEKAKQNGDSEWFDPKKTLRSENRYYFKEEKLIRWIGPDKKNVPASNKKFEEAENQIHDDVYMLVEYIDTGGGNFND